MITDYHTHAFPDRIAAATVSALEKSGGELSVVYLTELLAEALGVKEA